VSNQLPECPACAGSGTVLGSYCTRCQGWGIDPCEVGTDSEREAHHAPADEQFVHERLDRIERLLTDGAVPLATRLAARDEIERIRAELNPTEVRTEVTDE